MPECRDCGNRELFTASVRATEERVFDPDTGEQLDSKHLEIDRTLDIQCSECKSHDVSMS